MATYNAVIKESQERPKIIGKILLNNLTEVPDGWTVLFRNAVISSSTNIGKLMCSSKEPLTIYKKYDISKAKKDLQTVAKASTSKSPKEKDGSHKKEGEKAGLFRKQNISKPYLLQKEPQELRRFEPKARSSFISQKISNEGRNAVGIPTSNIWNAYGIGMNVVGECPNPQCQSKVWNASMGQSQVVYQSGYGVLSLTPDKHKFHCPGCDILFPVTKFYLCRGRSLFCFKKSETVDSEIETVVLEALGPQDKYSSFDNKGDQSLVKYEFIEVTTVEPGSSFYYCIACDEHCEEEKDEIILGCGHTYHKSTCGANMTNCMVCESTPFDSIFCLLTMNSDGDTEGDIGNNS